MSEPRPIAERRHVFHGRQDHPVDSFDSADATAFAMRLGGPAQRWSLRVDETTARVQGEAGGFGLTQRMNALIETANPDGERLSARLGPDEWLLVAGRGVDGDRDVAADLKDLAHTLVDISHRNIAIEMTGTFAADVINTGCPLDLGDDAFPVGTATRTLFAKAEIILMRRGDIDERPLYRIECWRSFGRYLFSHLQDSAQLLGIKDRT